MEVYSAYSEEEKANFLGVSVENYREKYAEVYKQAASGHHGKFLVGTYCDTEIYYLCLLRHVDSHLNICKCCIPPKSFQEGAFTMLFKVLHPTVCKEVIRKLTKNGENRDLLKPLQQAYSNVYKPRGRRYYFWFKLCI